MKNVKVKSAKRSFIMSVLSLILCFAMLLGTTYAWFTDSVTSGRNKIVAGNLDVELTHSNASVTNQKVQDATDLFGVALWEPGVIAWENFTVSNVGNLALKYALNLNVFDKNATTAGHDLTEVIKVAVIENGFSGDRAVAQALSFATLADFQKTGNLEGGDSTGDTFGVVLYWQPTDNDNLYNLKNGLASTDSQPLFVEFGVNLVATQDTVEADSFDKLYDATAPLAVMSTPMTKKLANTESLKIVVPEEAESSVKEASVPAAVANAVFDKVFTDSTTSDKSLTLVLNVEEKSKTDTTFNYDIDMDAVIKEITGTEVTKNETKSINELGLSFTDFVEVQMTIDSGLSNVTVKHNGNDMTEAASKAAIPTENQDPDGYFHYDETSGNLTLWTKTFSPFTVSGVKPFLKVVHSDGSETPYLPDNNLTKPKNFALKATSDTASTYGAISVKVADNDKIVLLDDCTVSGSSSWADTNSQVNADNAKDWCLGLLTYTLDLNGYTITASSSKYDSGVLNAGISIKSDFGKANYTLNIIDSSAEKTGKIVVNGNGSLFKFESNNGKSVWTININGGTFIANDEAATLFAVNKFGDNGFKGINRTTNTLNINVNGGTFNRDITTETPYINYNVSSQSKYYPVKAAEGYTFSELGNGMYGLIASN